ncbi:slipin family protein [Kordia sp. YSTF-M3]|uniref:Slipin family protein n=1 Tax=Kordia aestuariivivens TaxID=2759037 RepID=A0ABR7QAE0_9FLAO|nr:slipin family protein [Kordia aestuariivivens]MBC8755443.1 slipin family protein [Kordia aestuariivivens]
MKRARINVGNVGLVFKNGNYQKVITAGTYWLRFSQHVTVYNLIDKFQAPIASEILLQDETLANMLDVIDVKDNELVLLFEKGNIKAVLEVGQHLYWKGLKERTYTRIDLSKVEITEIKDVNLLGNHRLSAYIKKFEVLEYEKAILLIDDKFEKILDSGMHRFWQNTTNIKISKIDMRQLQLEISGQELLTKDKAAIRINFYTQYKVIDVKKAVLDNKDFEKQLYIAMQLKLRAFIGNYTLDELLEQKENIANAVFENIKDSVDALGIKVLSCGIRDVILTGEMKEIMNQVLIAQKKAQANIITRREETASTRSLLNTAKLMEENEMLFKLKEMEYVEKIAEKIGEITVAGNGGVVKQLKDIFSVNK